MEWSIDCYDEETKKWFCQYLQKMGFVFKAVPLSYSVWKYVGDAMDGGYSLTEANVKAPTHFNLDTQFAEALKFVKKLNAVPKISIGNYEAEWIDRSHLKVGCTTLTIECIDILKNANTILSSLSPANVSLDREHIRLGDIRVNVNELYDEIMKVRPK